MSDTENHQPRHAALDTLNDQKPMLSNQTYDTLKRFVTLGLPAFGVLYVAIAAIWGLPNPEAVSSTVLAVATFCGVLLNIAGRSYEKSDEMYDGVINVRTDPETGIKQAGLVLKNYENPAEVVTQSEARFKVVGS